MDMADMQAAWQVAEAMGMALKRRTLARFNPAGHRVGAHSPYTREQALRLLPRAITNLDQALGDAPMVDPDVALAYVQELCYQADTGLESVYLSGRPGPRLAAAKLLLAARNLERQGRAARALFLATFGFDCLMVAMLSNPESSMAHYGWADSEVDFALAQEDNQ